MYLNFYRILDYFIQSTSLDGILTSAPQTIHIGNVDHDPHQFSFSFLLREFSCRNYFIDSGIHITPGDPSPSYATESNRYICIIYCIIDIIDPLQRASDSGSSLWREIQFEENRNGSLRDKLNFHFPPYNGPTPLSSATENNRADFPWKIIVKIARLRIVHFCSWRCNLIHTIQY